MVGVRGIAALVLVLCAPAGSAANGIPAPYIILGQQIPETRYPWYVTVLSEFSDGSGTGLCGGFLVEERHVVTAAHCLYNSNSQPATATLVYLHDSGGGLRRPNPWRYTERAFVPSEYVGAQYWHGDVAVLRLSSAVAGIGVAPVAWSMSSWASLVGANGAARTVGYGVTELGDISDTLRAVDLLPMTETSCTSGPGPHWSPLLVHGDFCAGPSYCDEVLSMCEDTCFGDSGSPLFIDGGAGSPLVLGVVSRGYSDCGRGPNGGISGGTYPGIYTALYRFGGFVADYVPRPAGSTDWPEGSGSGSDDDSVLTDVVFGTSGARMMCALPTLCAILVATLL